ncbi:hypothetical protein L917_08104 [Phytophthora nicotianae]|uniref:C3H1-type domain-containing protein n=1 Tax=Phytophthora nicotianae TaxID=4792 RepID=W2L8U5_PHYNI|nr:hypothetical protein L917_08104 [Phytophthora nicotianae]
MSLEHNKHIETTSEDAKHVDLFIAESMTSQLSQNKTASSGQSAKRKSRQQLCRYFARSKCRDGEKCKFLHEKKPKKSKQTSCEEDAGSSTTQPAPAVEPEQKKKTRKCKYFAWNKCRNGDKCKFSHDSKNGGVKRKDDTLEPNLHPRAVVVVLGGSTEPETIKDEDTSEWSDAQQCALDLALKRYPASMDMTDRWTSIANEVDGRSLNECIDRFKKLCELVRSGVDPTTVYSSEEIATESIASERDPINSQIIPPEQRVAVETEPEVTGTQICLEDLFLHEIGTLVAHQLVCQLQCANCPLTFDATLSLDEAKFQRWCPRCSVLHHIQIRSVFAHAQSDVLAYLDTENCSIIDVLPSNMLATCLECGNEALLEGVAPSQRSEQVCFSCHTKLAVMAKRFLARQLEGSSRKRDDSATKPEAKQRPNKFKETFVLGQPLPRFGACNHYRHSLRWFRFQCCSKAFPCNVCHDSSDCSKANMGILATRMICGLCSKEQSSSVKVCSCGNDVASKKTTTHHWEGGTGCRNYFLMSRWDKQKHRGQNKTECTKFTRVGAEAKRRRESANANANFLVPGVH